MTEGERTDVLAAKLEALDNLMNERDRRYAERFMAMDEKTTLALESSKEAVDKAEAATEKRFDSVNEFRGTLKDQAAGLLPRAEADAKFTAIGKEIEEIKKILLGSQGKSMGVSTTWATVIALVFIALEIAGLILRK